MVPQSAYGDVVAGAFADAVKSAGATSLDVEHFTPNTNAVLTAVRRPSPRPRPMR